ncbi:hypothetical protein [Methylobacterium sp. Leaf118]|uniref:hypothetical protein n=1 Tax=Methylobacterium sp. Leaf118 TaxID=2876562 RepID=UPI001E28E0D7|nr:hypothetical protein [Methylobacterium sp. Leaf118]
MVQAAITKANRIRRLWPSRALRAPPPPGVVERPRTAPTRDEPLPPRGLTAHELIAMARAARARSLDDERDVPATGPGRIL